MYNDLRVHRNSLDKVESYKRYRNVLNRSLRIARSTYYYHRVLCENKDDTKKVWKVINELVYSNKRNRLGPSYLTTAAGDTVTDTQEIAKIFYEFFVNIGKSITDSSSQGNTSTTKVKALNQTCNSFYLSPCTPQEVLNVIKKLKTNKAKRTSDIETRFVEYANPVILVFLSKLINPCISDGIYPDSLRVAEVIPIFKNGGRDRTTNYRPISLLSIQQSL